MEFCYRHSGEWKGQRIFMLIKWGYPKHQNFICVRDTPNLLLYTKWPDFYRYQNRDPCL